jgi:cobaltochelatase CobS
LSRDEITAILQDYLQKNRIKLDDLSDEIKSYLLQASKVSLNITTSNFVGTGSGISATTFESPLFQKILSDAICDNNIYLYGGAGTGKTYIAEELAKFLGYDFIELNCNQFTSPLDILGGQTIEGYQRGKLERAWANIDSSGNYTGRGAVLCIDEMPKLDPNTAGVLNAALARVKLYKKDPTDPTKRIGATIENGKGDKLQKKDLVIIATGNSKLNEQSTEYEANFRQDLSLQDRFVGSTYEVTIDYENEWNETMSGFAFIYLPLLKLREKIFENKLTGFAFVSRRIMISLKDTYITYRNAKDNNLKTPQNIKNALKNPKTLKQGIDSFLNLFKPEAMTVLMQAMDYDAFMVAIATKENMSIDALDTKEEIDEVMEFIKRNKEANAKKIA